MTLETGLLRGFLMSGDFAHVLLLVAIKAELTRGLAQEFGFIRLVRGMAGRTIAIGCGVVFERRFGERLLQIIVAIEAELFGRLGEQLLVLRMVRRVARHAFAILYGLMLHF